MQYLSPNFWASYNTKLIHIRLISDEASLTTLPRNVHYSVHQRKFIVVPKFGSFVAHFINDTHDLGFALYNSKIA